LSDPLWCLCRGGRRECVGYGRKGSLNITLSSTKWPLLNQEVPSQELTSFEIYSRKTQEIPFEGLWSSFIFDICLTSLGLHKPAYSSIVIISSEWIIDNYRGVDNIIL
jgi:hypothetical protein